MREDEASRIESSIGRLLPPDYRQFLIEHGDELRRIKEALTFRTVIWTNPEEIVRENELARQYANAMTIGDEQYPWPESYMVVGTNGGGDYFFIHLDEPNAGLWLWEHETQKTKRIHPTFAAYLAALRNDMTAPEKWQKPPR